MSDPSPMPATVDPDVPSAARVYHYYLGGRHNFASDRAMGDRALAQWPALPRIMQANRAFLRRAVRYAATQGIDQFLDIGSGIPTVGNVHEVAQDADPAARVVYRDPVAVAHSRTILDGTTHTGVIEADFTHPDAVLGAPTTRAVLDLDRPVAVLLVAVLHFVSDALEPRRALARYRDAIAPGSLLVISHASAQGDPDRAGNHAEIYRNAGTPMTMRRRDEVAALFDGFVLVDPGVVDLPLWRPDAHGPDSNPPERFTGYAAVGRRD